MAANTQSLGAHGRQWNTVHAKRRYGEQLILTSDTFKIGSMDATLGSINTWWEATSAGIYPIGSRDLGANLSRVNTVYTSNVECNLINCATGACIGALDVTQPNVMDTMSLNGKRITQVGAPIDNTDVVNKAYADSAASVNASARLNAEAFLRKF